MRGLIDILDDCSSATQTANNIAGESVDKTGKRKATEVNNAGALVEFESHANSEYGSGFKPTESRKPEEKDVT